MIDCLFFQYLGGVVSPPMRCYNSTGQVGDGIWETSRSNHSVRVMTSGRLLRNSDFLGSIAIRTYALIDQSFSC